MEIIKIIEQKINNKTKPIGALGLLETIALQVALIQNTDTPALNNPNIIVFAADHGIAADGLVNPYPQAVTAQMVLNFVQGGAAINVFCKQNNIALSIVDAGVNIDFDVTLPIYHEKIAKGTKNYLLQDAMTEQQCNEAIAKGSILVDEMANNGCNFIGFGEMGISNTSSAALIMSAILQIPIDDCIGRGTGTNDEQLQTKKEILQIVFEKHQLQKLNNNPIQLLCKIGGFEIAMMVGAYLKAAALNITIVVDGFIATAALLIANKINNTVINHCIFAHTSGEQGHQKMLQHLQVQPLLQLGMRLGEGTGAALAMPLIQSAILFLNEMASFESAGVSNQ